ncbi:MAG: phasin family protein [Bacteroidota bacterium]
MSDSKSNSKIPSFGDLKASAEKVWLAGLGALSAVQDEGDKIFNNLVERGQSYETELKDQADTARSNAKEKATNVMNDMETSIRGFVDNAAERIGLPVEKQIQKLADHIENLTASISEMASEAREETAEAFESLRDKANEAADRARSAANQATAAAEAAKETLDSEYAMRHLGGGWYEILQNGEAIEKIQGKDNAKTRIEALSA